MRPLLPSALAAALLIAIVAGQPAAAHHSFAMYDSTKTVVIDGTVRDFQWTNPHAVLWVLDGPHADGSEPVLWTIELPTSPGNLTRMGWTKHSLSAGQRVTVELSPLRDGNHGGSFKKAVIADTGQVLTVSLQGLAKPDTPDKPADDKP